jgi:hypothetical protein
MVRRARLCHKVSSHVIIVEKQNNRGGEHEERTKGSTNENTKTEVKSCKGSIKNKSCEKAAISTWPALRQYYTAMGESR